MATGNVGDVKAEDWAGKLGENWLANVDRFESMLAPVGEAIIGAAAPKRGELALDVGCGGGWTTRRLARAVGPEGTATGLDISTGLAAAALAHAAKEGVSNFSTLTADATTAHLQPRAYDLIFSQFGVMFFSDPYAAFANLHRAAKPDGRLVFACWAPPKENEWILLIIGVVSQYIDLPAPVPRAPGPFAFGEPAYVTDILSKAGFRNVDITPWRARQYLGGSGAAASSAAKFVINALTIGEAVRRQPPKKQAIIEKAIAAAFEPFVTPGGVSLKATAWFVTALA